MKKLRICLVSPRSLPLFAEGYNSENVIGGAEINMYNLALSLSQMENTEVVVAVDDFGQPHRYKKGNIELIRISESTKNKGWLKRKLISISALINIFKINADAFVFTTSNRLLGILVFLQHSLKGKKVIFRLSSDLNLDLESFKKTNGALDYLLYKFGLFNADAIVSQTVKQKKLLKDTLGLESTIIENGFFIKKNLRPEDKKHILWVGRCMESKHPMKFIELARSLPDFKFVMIMPINKQIPESEKKQRQILLKSIMNQAKILPNLEVIDYVAYSKIQKYFDEAKFYVCTSDLEGFPNTFIQACLGGAPIISYSINPDNMINEFRLGLFARNDSQRAIEFIRRMDDRTLYKYMANLTSYAAVRHDIKISAGKYLELFLNDFENEKVKGRGVWNNADNTQV